MRHPAITISLIPRQSSEQDIRLISCTAKIPTQTARTIRRTVFSKRSLNLPRKIQLTDLGTELGYSPEQPDPSRNWCMMKQVRFSRGTLSSPTSREAETIKLAWIRNRRSLRSRWWLVWMTQMAEWCRSKFEPIMIDHFVHPWHSDWWCESPLDRLMWGSIFHIFATAFLVQPSGSVISCASCKIERDTRHRLIPSKPAVRLTIEVLCSTPKLIYKTLMTRFTCHVLSFASSISQDIRSSCHLNPPTSLPVIAELGFHSQPFFDYWPRNRRASFLNSYASRTRTDMVQ